jgi:hypothetical protein
MLETGFERALAPEDFEMQVQPPLSSNSELVIRF